MSFDIGVIDFDEGMVSIVCIDVGYCDSKLKYVIIRV